MHQTLNSDDIEKVIESDICIIGAGAAGISMAMELDKLGRSVLLLESGDFEYEQETQALNKGYSIGQAYYPLQSSRLRFFGGTTGHWTGQCSPLDDIDFEERDWVKNSGWPIKKSDLDPYYIKAQKICELQEYEYSSEYWEDKLEKKAIEFDKKLVRTKMWQKSAPTRFGTKYRSNIIDSKNIRLITDANLTRINLTEYGNQVESLKLSTLKKKTHTVKAKAYVMACGALQNVRHLLNSNNIINKGIGNENDLVGRFFMEHPHVDTADMVLLANTNMNLYYDGSLNSKAFGMFSTSQSIQRNLKLQNFSARVESNDSKHLAIDKDSDDAMGKLKQWENLDGRTEKVAKLRSVIGDRSTDWIIDKFVIEEGQRLRQEGDKLETSHHVLNTRSEQSPNPDSRVDLANTKDALGIPHTRLNWQLTESDKASILNSNLILGKELGRLGIGRLKINDWLFDKKIEWPKFLGGGWHHLGITRMHEDPKKGVVDKNCKVHSINNLYISSSSVFTTSGVANPTLTIVALSLRLADYLNKHVNRALKV